MLVPWNTIDIPPRAGNIRNSAITAAFEQFCSYLRCSGAGSTNEMLHMIVKIAVDALTKGEAEDLIHNTLADFLE